MTLYSIMETEYQVQFLNRRPKTISEQNTTMTIDLQTARSISLCGQKTFSLEICLLDAIKYYCQTSDGANFLVNSTYRFQKSIHAYYVKKSLQSPQYITTHPVFHIYF